MRRTTEPAAADRAFRHPRGFRASLHSQRSSRRCIRPDELTDQFRPRHQPPTAAREGARSLCPRALGNWTADRPLFPARGDTSGGDGKAAQQVSAAFRCRAVPLQLLVDLRVLGDVAGLSRYRALVSCSTYTTSDRSPCEKLNMVNGPAPTGCPIEWNGMICSRTLGLSDASIRYCICRRITAWWP